MARQHIAHDCQHEWHSERRCEPEPAGHVPQFATLFLLGVEPRLQGHTAYRAIAGSVPNDFGMHRASPLRHTCRDWDELRFYRRTESLRILDEAIPAMGAAKPKVGAARLIAIRTISGHRHSTDGILRNVLRQRAHAM